MYVSFDTLPASSRIWVYQTDRNFTDTEAKAFAQQLHTFCESWGAHGHPLQTSFAILYHRFLILAANQDFHAPSGCSIDSSVAVVRELGKQYTIDFFDRLKIGYFQDDAPSFVSTAKFKELVAAGEIDGKTLVFNNLIQNLGAVKSHWIVPAEQTWLSKYLPEAV